MESRGKLASIQKDWLTNDILVTFKVDSIGDAESLKDVDLDIIAKKHRKKRSLDANGLLWKCLGEIATTLRADKWQIYLQMLKRYGKYTYVCVKPTVVDAMNLQWRECEVVGEMEINGQKAVQMLCYFGSSTYDTKEFSVLLDGVVSEMKEMGLTPPPSKEMQIALEQWKNNGFNIK